MLFVGLTACCQAAVGDLNVEEGLICPTLSRAQMTRPGYTCQVLKNEIAIQITKDNEASQ